MTSNKKTDENIITKKNKYEGIKTIIELVVLLLTIMTLSKILMVIILLPLSILKNEIE